MQDHTKIYLKFFDYGEQDIVPCEGCGKPSNSVHHLIYRSKSGPDKVENLCALCYGCHHRVHNNSGGREFNNELKRIHKRKYEAWVGSTGKT